MGEYSKAAKDAFAELSEDEKAKLRSKPVEAECNYPTEKEVNNIFKSIQKQVWIDLSYS